MRNGKIVVTEKDLREQIRTLCKLYGWMMYFSWTSIHSPKGFPDLVLVNPDKCRVIYVELKTEKGKVSNHQQYWLHALWKCKQEVYIWRPDDIEDIARILGV